MLQEYTNLLKITLLCALAFRSERILGSVYDISYNTSSHNETANEGIESFMELLTDRQGAESARLAPFLICFFA